MQPNIYTASETDACKNCHKQNTNTNTSFLLRHLTYSDQWRNDHGVYTDDQTGAVHGQRRLKL